MMHRLLLIPLFLAAAGLGGCSVVGTAASVAGSAVGTAADVAGTAVSTTADVVTSPLRGSGHSDG